jgi:hypothetical protein
LGVIVEGTWWINDPSNGSGNELAVLSDNIFASGKSGPEHRDIGIVIPIGLASRCTRCFVSLFSREKLEYKFDKMSWVREIKPSGAIWVPPRDREPNVCQYGRITWRAT